LDLSVLWQDSGSNSCDCVLELHPGGQYRKGNGCEGLLQLTVWRQDGGCNDVIEDTLGISG